MGSFNFVFRVPTGSFSQKLRLATQSSQVEIRAAARQKAQSQSIELQISKCQGLVGSQARLDGSTGSARLTASPVGVEFGAWLLHKYT